MPEKLMPAVFVGHGSPMNAIEDNQFSRTWEEMGKALTKPAAILCISAHWETRGAQVTAMAKPRTIHDFGGFPPALYAKQYPAPGSPELAERISRTVKFAKIQQDASWGLDHGTWSVLCRMYPEADIPTLQLSLDRSQNADFHYELGRSLQELREDGILVIGSGNIVHNLRLAAWEAKAYDWAAAFDRQAAQWIQEGNHEALIHYERQGQPAALSINSAEHYLPLLYILGLKHEGEPILFSNEQVMAGSLSMRCVQIG
jgi:4,5-DOPA dioxygenase extradiol